MATLQKTFDGVRQIEMALSDLIASAIVHKMSMIEVQSEMKLRLYDKSSYQKLPNWEKEKIASYWYMARKSMVNEYIQIFYIGLDGRKIPTHKAWDIFTEAEKSVIRNGGEIRMVHLWMEKTIERLEDGTTLIKYTPTDKIYWESGMK